MAKKTQQTKQETPNTPPVDHEDPSLLQQLQVEVDNLTETVNQLKDQVAAYHQVAEEATQGNNELSPVSLGPDFSGNDVYKFFMNAAIHSLVGQSQLRQFKNEATVTQCVETIIDVTNKLTNETLDQLR